MLVVICNGTMCCEKLIKLVNHGMSLSENLRVFDVVLSFIALVVQADVASTIFRRGF